MSKISQGWSTPHRKTEKSVALLTCYLDQIIPCDSEAQDFFKDFKSYGQTDKWGPKRLFSFDNNKRRNL